MRVAPRVYTRTQLIQEIESVNVAEDATAEFARQTATLSSSTLADNSDPFTDIEDEGRRAKGEGQLETNELVIDNDGDQQDLYSIIVNTRLIIDMVKVQGSCILPVYCNNEKH